MEDKNTDVRPKRGKKSVNAMKKNQDISRACI
jgi:hypothetical protein